MNQQNSKNLIRSPKISVVVPTYNHEMYITKALDSIVNQKLGYDFEVIVGDDCSQDNTPDIVREYGDRYSDIMRVYLREKNVGAKMNGYYLMKKCRGEYIAILEGDDYWTDEYKLKKQIDFLDTHPDYIACAHRFKVVDKDENQYNDRDFLIQFIEGNIYTIKDFEDGKLVSHLNTLVFRNICKELGKKFGTYWCGFDNVAGDVAINLMLVSLGEKIYCMDDTMSCYRKVTDTKSTSFSAMQESKNERDRLFISQIQLQKMAKKVFGKDVDFSRRKKNIFASAVFKWRRAKTWDNWKVVFKIIVESGKPVRYFAAMIYLLSAKWILCLIYKEDRRVRF